MQTSFAADDACQDLDDQEFLVFTLGEEDYGVALHRVQEIREYSKPTRIAGAPSYLKGVFNLRGTIIPIIDLHAKLNIREAPVGSSKVVLVVFLTPQQMVGLIVDHVADVVTLTKEQRQPAPSLNFRPKESCVAGLGVENGRTIILMDLEKLVPGAGRKQFENTKG